jgi:polysaccharide chain length determinant protein (PEP-CTERM system associated)
VSVIQSGVLNPAFSPRSIISALWNRKVLILVLWILGSATAFAVVSRMRSVYRAEALILVESQKIPENFVAPTVQTALEARLDRLKQQVLSRERLWKLILEYDLYPKQRKTRPQEEVVQMMRRDMTISLERGWSASRPGAFRVAYEAFGPQTAADLANRIAHFFIDENLREREIEAQGTSEFLDSQLAESKRKLQEQEIRLSEFKVAYNGELPEQEAALLAAMSQSKAELIGLQDAQARAQQSKLILDGSLTAAQSNLKRLQDLARRRAEANAAAAAVPSFFAPSTQPPPPSELDLARARLRSLRLRYEDRHPEIQRLLGDIARLQKEKADRAKSEPAADAAVAVPVPQTAPAEVFEEPVREETLIGEKQRVESLKSQMSQTAREVENLNERRQRILQDVQQTQARLQKLPIHEQQLSAITRDYETQKTNYRSLLDKKLAADVAAQMEQWQKAERFVMLDAARVPEKAIRPKRMLLVAAGILLSLLAAAALAFVKELKRDVILGEWELPAGTVVLGRVPHMDIEPVKF